MTANTIHAEATNQVAENQKAKTTKAQICLGALMATATIAGIWGAVSLLISFFTG